MKAGYLVRLKQPFCPASNCPQAYCFGIVAGLVGVNSQKNKKGPEPMEIVIYLYTPETNTIYTDETGTQAMFCFYPDELTCLE